jgi:hypothetical protein
MAEYDNTNKWTLNKNTRRRNDKDSEYSGSANIECPHCNKTSDYWLNAWIRDGKLGKFFSGTTKPKQPAPVTNKIELNDEIPF